jgi:hypothetical protein
MAPSAYVLAPVLWVLALLATRIHGIRARVVALALAWIVVVGPPPLPDHADLIVNLACQAVVIALSVAVAWSSRLPARTAQVAGGALGAAATE